MLLELLLSSPQNMKYLEEISRLCSLFPPTRNAVITYQSSKIINNYRGKIGSNRMEGVEPSTFGLIVRCSTY